MSLPVSPPLTGIAGLDMASLAAGYRSGALAPTAVVRAVFERIDAAGRDNVWISLVGRETVLEQARRLEALPARERDRLALYGVPFAVKDNIDVRGFVTTAACPAVTGAAARDATVVTRLIEAGAILIGKTNMDQFATGLVGVRSPYGIPRNPFDADVIPGGSSSGSAVAVASGLVAFALGTDTAGSGRVPAAFNNIVGLKPTRGLVSTAGVLPACRTLDCVSVFALSVGDAMTVLSVLAEPDPGDPFSRPAPLVPPAARRPFRFGVPRPEQRQFFEDGEAERLYGEALDRLAALGGQQVEIDFAPFSEAAAQLYEGPWLAERFAAVGHWVETGGEAVLPVIRRIIGAGARPSAIETFKGFYRLAELQAASQAAWAQCDVLALPTTPTIYRIAEVEADPIGCNSRLGIYTNFTNLFDLCGLAVPSGFRADGLPAGITLLAPAFREAMAAGIADAFHRALGLAPGRGGAMLPAGDAGGYGTKGLIRLLVVGGHLAGQPLNPQLTDVGARLVGAVRTAPDYRLHALPGEPARPGMLRVNRGGAAILGEIWEMAPDDFGRFVAAVPPPLGIGPVRLEDGSLVSGFLCEAAALEGTADITAYGGWRAWLMKD